MYHSRIISIAIDQNWLDFYEAYWRPRDFSKWASGLSRSELAHDGVRWNAEVEDGTVSIRFTGYNQFGVMDHYVSVNDGPEIYVPLRVIENGGGAEVQLTLFQQPGTSDAKFLADAEWVEQDLLTLKLLTSPDVSI